MGLTTTWKKKRDGIKDQSKTPELHEKSKQGKITEPHTNPYLLERLQGGIERTSSPLCTMALTIT